MAKKNEVSVTMLVFEINALVASCVPDAKSSDKGNVSACKRLRKKIREIREQVNVLSKDLSDLQAKTKKSYSIAHRGWGNKNNRVVKSVTNKTK